MDDNLRTIGESTTIILNLVFIPFLGFDVLMHSTLEQDCLGFFFWLCIRFYICIYMYIYVQICNYT